MQFRSLAHNVLPLGEVGNKQTKLINLKTIKQMENSNSVKPNTQSYQTAVMISVL
jgi:hypothetical protein